MKGIVLVMDGMGDRPLKEADNQTLSKQPILRIMDEMAKNGIWNYGFNSLNYTWQ